MEGQQGMNSERKKMIMSANNLSYKFDSVLNLSDNRTLKKQYFDTREYKSDSLSQAVSTWNTGVSLVDTKNSYLKLDFLITDGTGVTNFGIGSVMNLINEVKITHTSGVELSRTQNANHYHCATLYDRHDNDWLDTTGTLMGVTQEGTNIEVDKKHTYLIPLCELDPFFELYDDKLLPANIASGLRIELTFENLNKAIFKAPGTEHTSYTISGIEFRTQCVDLYDSAISELNKEASTNGLEITYDRIHTVSSQVTTTSDNIEVRKAVGLAKKAIAVFIPTASLANQETDSFKAAQYNFTSWDYRLGNQYYPHQAIENAAEAYYTALITGQNTKYKSPGISLSNFTDDGYAKLACMLETDDSLNLSALPINSSRILELRFTRSVSTAVTAFVFLTYTTLTRASLSNCSVKI